MGQMADGEDLRKIFHHRRSMRRAAKCEDDLWEAQQGRSYCGHLRPSLSVSVLPRPPTNCQKTPTNLMVAFSGANSYSGSPNGEWIKHWSQGIKTGMNELKDDAKCDSDMLVNKHVLL